MLSHTSLRARFGVLATLASAMALSACATTGGSGGTASASDGPAKSDNVFAATKAGDPVFTSCLLYTSDAADE